MRLGGPLFRKFDNPQEWIEEIKRAGYKAVYCPVDIDTGNTDSTIFKSYRAAASAANIIISEVGAWSNPLSGNIAEKKSALEKCKRSLWAADELGACCCVNIAGSRGEKWDGPYEKDLTDETFDMIIYTVRNIIDEVKPKNSFYTLEPMPWMYPDSAYSYLKLYKAIDRKSFGVHYDPVNLIKSPQDYFNNKEVITDFIKKLGPYIKSCHAKDVLLGDTLTVHLTEVCPGEGKLDYAAYLKALDGLPNDVPLMMEHMKEEHEYIKAAKYIRGIAEKEGIDL